MTRFVPKKKTPNLSDRKIGFLSRKWITLATHSSYLISRVASKQIPIIFVTGFPKSGTVWVTQLVADYLQYPFVDLSFFPTGCPSVMHAHYLVTKNSPPMVYVVRDGRDAIVSMYFYMARNIPEGNNPKLPLGYKRYFKGLKNKNDVKSFLPTFIRRQFHRPFGCRWNWTQHVGSYFQSNRQDIPIVKYESLLANPYDTAAEAISILTNGEQIDKELLLSSIQKYSFTKQTGRKVGEENKNSFVRKGQAGDWKNHFTLKAAETFDELAGKVLVDLGYESDRNWFRDIKSD